jgi:hypothetical protein
MDTLVETRWTRYGHDRVYVSTCEGLKVGHVDLKTGSIGVELPGFSAALDDCKRRWFVGSPVPPPPIAATSPVSLPPPAPIATSSPAPRTEPEMAVPMPPPPSPAIEPMVRAKDLAANAPGAAAKAKRDEVNASAPVLNFVARVFGVKTDERNWRVGAVGEQKVGRELAKLGPHWRMLHAVEVGTRGADIDHFVIGPAGVFVAVLQWMTDDEARAALRPSRPSTAHVRIPRATSPPAKAGPSPTGAPKLVRALRSIRRSNGSSSTTGLRGRWGCGTSVQSDLALGPVPAKVHGLDPIS